MKNQKTMAPIHPVRFFFFLKKVFLDTLTEYMYIVKLGKKTHSTGFQ